MGYKDGSKPPDGYERTGDGQGIRLVDPAWCLNGHPFDLDQRGYAPCAEHRGHPKWTCRCGATLYRIVGEYVDALGCR